MTNLKTLYSVALVATMALAAAPAQAQHRGGGGHGGGGATRGAAVSHGSGSRGAVVSTGHAQARSSAVYRGGSVVGVAPGATHVVVGHSGYYRPYYGYRPYYAQPYYAFHPHVSIGFGFWAGYPVPYSSYYAYPYSYGYAYPYAAAPYAYGYPAQPSAYPAQPYPPAGQSSVYPSGPYPPSQYPNSADDSAQQSAPPESQQGYQSAASGGVSFQITPDTAEVYVDGSFVGTAGSFGPRNEPLGLSTGRHHIEVRAPGYRTMSFDADIQSGQVIPYQGQLQHN